MANRKKKSGGSTFKVATTYDELKAVNDRICELYSAGASATKVSLETGIHLTHVYNVLKARGIVRTRKAAC